MEWRVSIDIAAHMAHIRMHHKRTLEYLALAICAHLQTDPAGMDFVKRLKPGAEISNRSLVLEWLQSRFSADLAFECYPWPSIEEFVGEFQYLCRQHHRSRGMPHQQTRLSFGPGTEKSNTRRQRIARERLSLAICRELNIPPLDHSLAPYFDAGHHTSNHQVVAQWLEDQGYQPSTATSDQHEHLVNDARKELSRRLPPHLQG